jgi:hypothetical protein
MKKPTQVQKELMDKITNTIKEVCVLEREDYDYVKSLVACQLLIMDKVHDFKFLGGQLLDINKMAVNGMIALVCDFIDADLSAFWEDIRSSIKAMDKVIDILDEVPDNIDPFIDQQ